MADSSTLKLTFDPEGDLLDAARACEAEVFFSTYGNTREEWDHEYGVYESSSAFITLSEPGGDVVATSRLIMPNGIGLKSLDDVSRSPWLTNGYESATAAGLELDETLDIATISVRKGLKGPGRLAAIAMYHGIVTVTRANHLPNVVMIMDARARRLLSAIGCATFALPATSPGPYLGSTSSTPLWANVPRMMDNQRRVNPEAFRLVSQGVGLDGISIPSLADFTLRGNQLGGTRSVVAALIDLDPEIGVARPLPDPRLDLLGR